MAPPGHFGHLLASLVHSRLCFWKGQTNCTQVTGFGRNLLYFSEDKALKHVVRNEGFGQRVRLGQPMLGIG